MTTLRSAPMPTVRSLAFLLLLSASVCFAKDTPRCHTSDLTLRTLPGTVAAGKGDQTYAFQNRSAKSCMLGGFPSLRALDKKGALVKPVEFKQVRDIWSVAEQPLIPSRIILKPGEEVWFQLVFTFNSIYHGDVEDRSMCHMMGTLLITPPGNRKPLAAEFSGQPCNPIRYTPVFLPIPGWR
jgi:Protein of unknown function (DUF4232)